MTFLRMIPLVLVLAACGPVEHPQRQTWDHGQVTIVTYDGCEYLFANSGHAFSHKGNCGNPIHKRGQDAH